MPRTPRRAHRAHVHSERMRAASALQAEAQFEARPSADAGAARLQLRRRVRRTLGRPATGLPQACWPSEKPQGLIGDPGRAVSGLRRWKDTASAEIAQIDAAAHRNENRFDRVGLRGFVLTEQSHDEGGATRSQRRTAMRNGSSHVG